MHYVYIEKYGMYFDPKTGMTYIANADNTPDIESESFIDDMVYNCDSTEQWLDMVEEIDRVLIEEIGREKKWFGNIRERYESQEAKRNERKD